MTSFVQHHMQGVQECDAMALGSRREGNNSNSTTLLKLRQINHEPLVNTTYL